MVTSSNVSKIYEIILESRLGNVTQRAMHQAQSGFRAGCSVQDHIFTIRNLFENVLKHNQTLLIKSQGDKSGTRWNHME